MILNKMKSILNKIQMKTTLLTSCKVVNYVKQVRKRLNLIHLRSRKDADLNNVQM